jgi:ferredoxin-type protein NapH
MADHPAVAPRGAAHPRGAGSALLWTLPMLLWSLLMFSGSFRIAGRAPKLAAALAVGFMVALFFLMLRTGQTYRFRRIYFVALGFLFPVGFIWELLTLRGSMSIPVSSLITGDTPFCFLAIPMMIVPAALTRSVIFPGSILPTASNPNAIAPMVGLWLAASLLLGKGWCSFGCFFGGLEEGFAAVPRRARWKKIDPRWRWAPWGVLLAVVLLAAATFEPIYCSWLCPFKAVTEFPEVSSLRTAVQAGIFITLFAGLVVLLPLLTRRRTQCAFFCPFGVFQSLTNKLNIFDVRIDKDRCPEKCEACQRSCPTLALDRSSIQKGQTLITCMRCGACVDTCPRGAAVWHVKGTSITASPETARLIFLFTAWAFATMFGGSIIASSLQKLLHRLG